MYRRVFLLMGLAIVAVVCNHAAGWGYTAMFWWTDRYRPVTVPNFDQTGTLPYYGLLLLKQLTLFSVPASSSSRASSFLTPLRGRKSGFGWKTGKGPDPRSVAAISRLVGCSYLSSMRPEGSAVQPRRVSPTAGVRECLPGLLVHTRYLPVVSAVALARPQSQRHAGGRC